MGNHKGFSLPEILIALAVLIATAAGVTIMGKDLISAGKYSTAKAGSSALALAVSHYRFEIDAYPTTLNDLTAKKNNKGPWIETDALTDPWGQNYNYVVNSASGKFAVWSNGANKVSESSISAIGGDDAGVLSH